jgi:hypothetical protein
MQKPSKLLICVTFYFVSERLAYLRKIASTFANLADIVEVFIITNSIDKKTHILQSLADYDLNVKIVSPFLLGHPFLLTWCHFDIFRRVFHSDTTVTHFLYLEDDIYVTPENINYWIEGRKRLAPLGVIPSFLRYEIDNVTGELFSTDVTTIVNPIEVPIVHFQQLDYAYLNLPQPYQGMYLLDRELMEEHLTTNSCNPDFGIWGIREKAAQGITFFNVPKGFTSRNLIGYNVLSQEIDPRCLVYHLANNYVTNPNVPFAKISISNLIAPLVISPS